VVEKQEACGMGGASEARQEPDGAVGAAASEATEVACRLDRNVDPVAIAAVYGSVGWDHLSSDPARLGEALRSCAEVATAWAGSEAVGVARLLSDGVFHGLILGVAVRPEWQRQGIGSRLVRTLIERNPEMHYHLWTRSRRFAFYGRLGFRRDETAMERPATGREAPSGR
jgi:GNAT superfamily N-acetyltransferase